MLAECESEKSKWVVALGELHRILRRNQPPDRQIFTAMLAFDSSTISNIRSLTSACVLDMGGVLTAGGGGLALLDAARREVTPRRAHAPHHAARRVPRDQLIVTIAGRGRYVRLVPLRALECADVECVKVRDSKGAIDICVGEISDRAMGFACVCKRQNAYIVNVYEITRTAARRVRIAELRAPSAVLSIQLWRGALVLGHRGGFVMHQLPPRDAPPITLVHPDNQVNMFLCHSGARPIACAQTRDGHRLLIFNTLALYVRADGHRARDIELMYTQPPLHHAINDNYLLIFTATHIDVYDIEAGEWVQTINLPNARPLDENGWLVLVTPSANNASPFSSDAGPYVVYLHTPYAEGPLDVEQLCASSRKRFTVRELSHQSVEAHNRLSERRSRLISAPSNFAHVSHMGPGDGIRSQRLLDLPTTVDTADRQIYSSRDSSKRTSPLTLSHGTGSYNGSWRGPPRPRDQPPAVPAPPSPPPDHMRMERSIGGGSQGSGSLLLERSITPLSLGSMSSLHDVLKVGTDMCDNLQSEDSSGGGSPPHASDA
ncbi:hypothetical protein JYU34_022313 [Plutella xylostella]|uniref:Uncharacterized protein n=2 Tax=Plutella xylostella TaxID=51655 RepID=A0ABQ7PR80_PLUXY|nr:hypothetical protein JYU34_022313 [Plutella xylostella]